MDDLIGHNKPDMTETVQDTAQSLSDWMKDNPVISEEDQARQAKLLIDRGKLALADMETERDSKVRPLNTQVKEINEHYRPAKSLMNGVLDEIQGRLTAFIQQEEAKRHQALAEARAKAEESEKIAREAEERERGIIDSAAHGELGLDIAAATQEADSKFAQFEKDTRQAVIAERDATVRIGGGFRRALSLKTIVEPTVPDYAAAILAIQEMGLTDDIRAAIIKSARAYKKLNGQWPRGIHIETERKV